MNSIKIKNLSFKYQNNVIFDNISFSLPLCSCSIIGPSQSGKTTLLNLLSGREKGTGTILINAIDLNDANFKLLRRYFAVVFKNDILIKERVIDELRYPLENQNIKPKEIVVRAKELLEYFNLIDFANIAISSLNYVEKMKIKILSYLIMKPKYIALDDILIELDEEFVNKFLMYLQTNGIYLINVTTDMEELLYTEYVICLYNHKIAFEGPLKQIVMEEKLFKRLGFSLPFIVDLSIQLKWYGMINEIYFNDQQLMEAIWK